MSVAITSWRVLQLLGRDWRKEVLSIEQHSQHQREKWKPASFATHVLVETCKGEHWEVMSDKKLNTTFFHKYRSANQIIKPHQISLIFWCLLTEEMYEIASDAYTTFTNEATKFCRLFGDGYCGNRRRYSALCCTILSVALHGHFRPYFKISSFYILFNDVWKLPSLYIWIGYKDTTSKS